MKTITLVGYVDSLISDKKIPSWDNALGLYVIGRPDPAIRQLENAIMAERRSHQLRIISVESLLSLAEMMNDYDVSYEDVLALIRPSGPSVDSVIDIMARLVAEPEREQLPQVSALPEEQPSVEKVSYWLTPVKSDEKGRLRMLSRRL